VRYQIFYITLHSQKVPWHSLKARQSSDR